MATEDQLLDSKQKTFTNWKAQVLSYPLREAMLGILNPGVVCGFDTLHLYPDAKRFKLGLSHERTGIRKTIYKEGGGTGKSAPTGVLISGFGTIIHSEEEVGVEVMSHDGQMPTEDGYYMIYAWYNRTSGIGPEPYNRVSYHLSPVRIKEYTDFKDTINESDLVGQNALSETMIPVSILLILQGKPRLLSEIVPEGDWGYEYRNNKLYPGMMSKLDMISCFGTFGIGRFKYLGRTLDSIFRYVNEFLVERDDNRDQWREMLHKLNMSSGGPEGPYNDIPLDNSGVPEEYIKARDENGKPIYKDPTFIKEIFSVWLDLLILDQECTQLWDKLGYPETQPETEKVLMITKTVWENMLGLKAHSEFLSGEIWKRLGLQSTGDVDGPADAWSILNKAETVWNNLLSIVDKLGKLDDFVRKDKDGVSDNLSRIWQTIGYEKGKDPISTGPLTTNLSIWDNLKNLYGYITLNVERSNNFNIRQEQAREKGVESPLKICSAPWFLNREPTLEEIIEYRKTFVWEITNVPQLDAEAIAREYELYVDVPYKDIEGYTEPEQRVGFIIWRPDMPTKKLYLQNVITQVRGEDGSELFLNNGGVAMLYKITKADEKWHVQIINSGEKKEQVSAGGLLPGRRVYDTTNALVDIPNTGQGQDNYLKKVSDLAKYLLIDSSVGMNIINYEDFTALIRAPWGTASTIPLKVDKPIREGDEIIIKLGGRVPRFGQASEPTLQNRLKTFTGPIYEVCLNFSLPLDSIDIELVNHYSMTGADGRRGIVTNNYDTTSYLKWPGDWVRLRSETMSDGTLKWRIIENFRNTDIFILLGQARIYNTQDSKNKVLLRDCFPGIIIMNGSLEMPRVEHVNGDNSINTYIAITSRNHLRYQQFEWCDGTNNYGYAFSTTLPFPYPAEVGQTRPSGDIDSEHGNSFYWLSNPESEDRGVVGVSNHDYLNNWEGDNDNYHLDAGWDFPLGGPLAALRNYVFHDLIL